LLTYDNGDGRKLTMVAQLGQLLATVWATSGASPATMTAPAGAMDLGEPLRAIISARIVVKWCGSDEARSLARWQEKVA
jgi:hypothetical protein